MAIARILKIRKQDPIEQLIEVSTSQNADPVHRRCMLKKRRNVREEVDLTNFYIQLRNVVTKLKPH